MTFNPDSFDSCLEQVTREYPDAGIVPFAIYSEDEDFFYNCFMYQDGEEAFVIGFDPRKKHDFTEQYECTFAEWLKEAIDFSSKFQAAMRVYEEDE